MHPISKSVLYESMRLQYSTFLIKNVGYSLMQGKITTVLPNITYIKLHKSFLQFSYLSQLRSLHSHTEEKKRNENLFHSLHFSYAMYYHSNAMHHTQPNSLDVWKGLFNIYYEMKWAVCGTKTIYSKTLFIFYIQHI